MQIAGFIRPGFEISIWEMSASIPTQKKWVLFMVLTALKNYILKHSTATSLSRINVAIALDNPQNTLSSVCIGTVSSVESSPSGNIYCEVNKETRLLGKDLPWGVSIIVKVTDTWHARRQSTCRHTIQTNSETLILWLVEFWFFH